MISLHLKGTQEAKEAFAPLFKELKEKGIEYRLKDYNSFMAFDCDQVRGFVSEVPYVNGSLIIDTELMLICTSAEVGAEKIVWHQISLKFICSIYAM